MSGIAASLSAQLTSSVAACSLPSAGCCWLSLAAGGPEERRSAAAWLPIWRSCIPLLRLPDADAREVRRLLSAAAALPVCESPVLLRLTPAKVCDARRSVSAGPGLYSESCVLLRFEPLPLRKLRLECAGLLGSEPPSDGEGNPAAATLFHFTGDTLSCLGMPERCDVDTCDMVCHDP